MSGDDASFAQRTYKTKIRLETISLRDLFGTSANIPSGLSTCYFVVGGKVDKGTHPIKPQVPVILGVFSVSGEPPTAKPGDDFGKPNGDFTLRQIVKLLNDVTFTVNDETLTSSPHRTKYTIHTQEVTVKQKGPNGADLDTVIKECSLLDILVLVQNYAVTVTNLSNRHQSGPYLLVPEPSCAGHTNLELSLAIGPMPLDCVVTYLSLFDFRIKGVRLKADLEVEILGTGLHCCYGNKIHGL